MSVIADTRVQRYLINAAAEREFGYAGARRLIGAKETGRPGLSGSDWLGLSTRSGPGSGPQARQAWHQRRRRAAFSR